MANRISVTSQPLNPNGVSAGTTPNLTAPTADGDVVDAGRVWVLVSNTDSVTWTVTVDATKTVDGLAVSDLVATVAAGKVATVGPFPVEVFGQPAGANASGGDDRGRVYVNYTSSGGTIASLKRAAVSV